MRLYKLMISKKIPALLVCLSQEVQYEITLKIVFSWGKWCWSIVGVG